jgi:hypothetical protein
MRSINRIVLQGYEHYITIIVIVNKIRRVPASRDSFVSKWRARLRCHGCSCRVQVKPQVGQNLEGCLGYPHRQTLGKTLILELARESASLHVVSRITR